MVFSFVSPWWGMSDEYRTTYSKGVMRYSLSMGLFTSSVTLVGGYYSNGIGLTGGFSIFSNTPLSGLFMLTALLLFFGAMFVALYIYRLVRCDLDERTSKWTMRLGTVGAIALFLAPIVFAIGLPGAYRQNLIDVNGSYADPGHQDPSNTFAGSFYNISSGVTESTSWGGDTGWILSFVASIVLLMSLASLYLDTMRAARPSYGPMGQSPPMMPAGYQRPVYQRPPDAPHDRIGPQAYAPVRPQPPSSPEGYQAPPSTVRPRPSYPGPPARPYDRRQPQAYAPLRSPPPQPSNIGYTRAPPPPSPPPPARSEGPAAMGDTSFRRPRGVRRRNQPLPPPPPGY